MPGKRLFPQLALAALLAVVPKCLACGLAYAGLLGLGGVELCGESAPAWTDALPLAIGVVSAVLFIGVTRCRRMAHL